MGTCQNQDSRLRIYRNTKTFLYIFFCSYKVWIQQRSEIIICELWQGQKIIYLIIFWSTNRKDELIKKWETLQLHWWVTIVDIGTWKNPNPNPSSLCLFASVHISNAQKTCPMLSWMFWKSTNPQIAKI